MKVERYPVRQREPRGIGWQVTKDGEKQNCNGNFETVHEAKVFANKVANCVMAWTQSERTNKFGEYWYNAQNGYESWGISVEYIRDREPIPGAMFISQDPACNIYIEPVGNEWHVKLLKDFTDMSLMDVIARTNLAPIDAHVARHVLQHILFFKAQSKELAMHYGLYVWGKYLVSSCTRPDTGSKWRNKLRDIAINWI